MVFLATSLARDRYAFEPEQLGSYLKADMPWLGASARRTFLGIKVQNNLSSNYFLSCAETSTAKLFLLSYMVLTTPIKPSLGFTLSFI